MPITATATLLKTTAVYIGPLQYSTGPETLLATQGTAQQHTPLTSTALLDLDPGGYRPDFRLPVTVRFCFLDVATAWKLG
jgi:hypothetical protein